MKVLLVDDEPEIVEYLRLVLESHQVECVGVFSPEEGIKAAQAQVFDAIVTDFKMPKMTGLEMIAHIRGGTQNSSTPVVVLSGALTDDILLRLEKLGIIDVMSKPPDIEILVRIIEKSRRNNTRTTEASYNQDMMNAFHAAFEDVMKGHLGHLVTITTPVVSDTVAKDIEFSGVVTMVGRRMAGVLAISYQSGFTGEFARTLLGRPPSEKELEIFESTTGEVAEQVVQQAIPVIQGKCGLHLIQMTPLIQQGRRAGIPLPLSQPRIASMAILNGMQCLMEYALIDLNQVFAGTTDEANAVVMS